MSHFPFDASRTINGALNVSGAIDVSGSATLRNTVTIGGNRIDDAWTSYTPIWTGAVTNPVLGDGTLVGAYKQVGKIVFVRVKLSAGSTTTFGTGAWYFTLPVVAKTTEGVQLVCSMRGGTMLSPNWYVGIVNGAYGEFTDKSAIITSASPAVAVSAGDPFIWSQGHTLQFNGSYEIV